MKKNMTLFTLFALLSAATQVEASAPASLTPSNINGQTQKHKTGHGGRGTYHPQVGPNGTQKPWFPGQTQKTWIPGQVQNLLKDIPAAAIQTLSQDLQDAIAKLTQDDNIATLKAAMESLTPASQQAQSLTPSTSSTNSMTPAS